MIVRPIIFQPEMIRALLAGRKTQTRRLRWGKPTPTGGKPKVGEEYLVGPEGVRRLTPLARVKAGDVLYVRENFSGGYSFNDAKPKDWPARCPIWYWADGNPTDGDWTPPKPSIHLPRQFSRITLRVTEVRFEPVQNISDADAVAEGIVDRSTRAYLPAQYGVPEWPDSECCAMPATAYRRLWRSINGAESWDENPEVVVLSGAVILHNVDKYLEASA